MSADGASALPLAGLTVIDASTILAGPLAAATLGDYGARVIKVENPRGGDNARRLGKVVNDEGSWWTFLSRNKECVTCDLAKDEGIELFRRMVAKADVLIENFRPGRLERWGMSPESLLAENPKLVILRISGFGLDGPYSPRPGYGTVAEAYSGFHNVQGFPDGPPILPGVPVADAMTGTSGALACMIGVWRAKATGRGSVIDLPLYGPMLQMTGVHVTGYVRSGKLEGRAGNRMGTTPRNAHRCSDGKWIAYSGQSIQIIQGMIDLFQVGDDPRFADPVIALRNGLALDDVIGEWISARPRDEVIVAFAEAGIPIGPIYDDDDVLIDPHMHAREEYLEFAHHDGPLRMPAGAFRVIDPLDDAVPTRRTDALFTGSGMGEHNAAIYGEWLDLPADELERLADHGVI